MNLPNACDCCGKPVGRGIDRCQACTTAGVQPTARRGGEDSFHTAMSACVVGGFAVAVVGGLTLAGRGGVLPVAALAFGSALLMVGVAGFVVRSAVLAALLAAREARPPTERGLGG